jgi:hypothetical protein
MAFSAEKLRHRGKAALNRCESFILNLPKTVRGAIMASKWAGNLANVGSMEFRT